jgi:hypothetical protein
VTVALLQQQLWQVQQQRLQLKEMQERMQQQQRLQQAAGPQPLAAAGMPQQLMPSIPSPHHQQLLSAPASPTAPLLGAASGAFAQGLMLQSSPQHQPAGHLQQQQQQRLQQQQQQRPGSAAPARSRFAHGGG